MNKIDTRNRNSIREKSKGRDEVICFPSLSLRAFFFFIYHLRVISAIKKKVKNARGCIDLCIIWSVPLWELFNSIRFSNFNLQFQLHYLWYCMYLSLSCGYKEIVMKIDWPTQLYINSHALSCSLLPARRRPTCGLKASI